MTVAHHCDRDGCNSWQSKESQFPAFLELWEGNKLLAHFCTLWCLVRWGADRAEPTEVIA
jgi:hypothetical protein